MIESFPTAGVFVGLAAAASYYMWGLAFENRVFEYAAAACHPVSHTLRRDYTFIPPRETGVDNILCVLVSFFNAVFSLPRSHPFLQSFSAVVAVPVAITYLESYRPSSPAFVKYSPLIFGLMCQTLGSAFAYPLYYAVYCLVVETPLATRLNDRGDGARTVLVSIVLGYFVTATLMADPLKLLTQVPADTQAYLSALWQVFPVTLTVMQALLRTVMPKGSATTANFATYRDSALNGLMLLSTLLHFASLFALYQSVPKGSSFIQALQDMVTVPGGIHPTGFAESAYVFLLFDALFLTVSTFLFVLVAPGRTTNLFKLVFGMVGLSLTAGPATAFLWGWKVREGRLSSVLKKTM